jgi:hypothetical protein
VNEVALQLHGLPGEKYTTLGRMLEDLPARLLHWAGVLIPAVFAAGALFVMLLTLVFGRSRKAAMA